MGDSVHLGYVDQSRDALNPNNTVWEEISGGAEVIYLDDKEINSRAYCSSFNFKGAAQQAKVGDLSGGQRNRVHLAKVLKKGANVLLLDEPTNDLDTETLAALEDALEKLRRLRRYHQPRSYVPSTVWPHTCSPLKATAMLNGSKATSKTTKRTRSAALAHMPPTRAGSSTSRLRAKRTAWKLKWGACPLFPECAGPGNGPASFLPGGINRPPAIFVLASGTRHVPQNSRLSVCGLRHRRSRLVFWRQLAGPSICWLIFRPNTFLPD